MRSDSSAAFSDQEGPATEAKTDAGSDASQGIGERLHHIVNHIDGGLDWYDLYLAQTFPASDALPLWR